MEKVADSEFGRLVLQPAGLVHALGAALQPGEGVFVSLWFFRAASRPFREADGQTLAAWLPHVAPAFTIQQRVSSAEYASTASAAAFDRLALGAVLVDESARPLIINRLAERILAAGDGLRVTGGALSANSHAATTRLHAAVRDTARRRRRPAARAAPACAWRGRCGQRPWISSSSPWPARNGAPARAGRRPSS